MPGAVASPQLARSSSVSKKMIPHKKWGVQSSWTGELDIYDIMNLKFANDRMQMYQKPHNWIGTTNLRKDSEKSNQDPTFFPPPFGQRTPLAAREFNLALLHDRHGKDGLEARRLKDLKRRKLIAKMAKRKADRGRTEAERFSPAAEYQKWCEPINYAKHKKDRAEEKKRVGNLDFSVRGFDKAGRTGFNPAGPKVGEHINPPAATNRSPGPVYNITPAELALVQRSAPTHKIAHKIDHGSFLDAIGAIPRPGVPPRSDPDAIGLAPVSWDGTARGDGKGEVTRVLDRGDAAARHAGNGKSFGVRHRYLDQKFPKDHPGPADYEANEASKRTQQSQSWRIELKDQVGMDVPTATMGEKLEDRALQEASEMPGPGKLRGDRE
jgi:hypothetical protein